MSASALRDLIEITRQQGNTTALILAAQTTGATVITADAHAAGQLAKQDIAAATLRDNLRGRTGPYLLDLDVLATIAEEWQEQTDRDAATITRLRGKLAKIAALAAE